MNRYTILCSQEQTRNAIKLGAPIREAMSRYNARLAYERIQNNKETMEEYNKRGIAILAKRAYDIPTAEQMLGWLEEQGILIDIHFYCVSWDMGVRTKTGHIVAQKMAIDSHREATLAAIDAALEYLISL